MAMKRTLDSEDIEQELALESESSRLPHKTKFVNSSSGYLLITRV
jgi:hypothetical protein